MAWYNEPGARAFIRVWPPSVDQMATDLIFVRSQRSGALDLRSEVQPPNMFEWRGTAADQHMAEKKAIRRQLTLAAESLSDMETAMTKAVVGLRDVVAADRARYLAHKARLAEAAR